MLYLLIFTNLISEKWYLDIVLIYISLIMSEMDHLFMGYVCMCVCMYMYKNTPVYKKIHIYLFVVYLTPQGARGILVP